MILIAADALEKRYDGGVTALDGLTVEIESGIVGLVGANGAGKSTLIKLALGLLRPTAGTVKVLGLDPIAEAEAVRARVGYMPEHDCLPPDVSAAELITHLARVSGLPAATARERASETLRHVGMYEERYRQIGGYSTGMRQRVKLAQALVHDPDLLLLDEPTSGMDPAGREQMLDLVVEAWERRGAGGGTRPLHVLLSTHLLPDVERTCDHVILLDRGAVRWSGPLAELMGSDPRLFAVRVKSREADLAAALRARGCEVEEETSGELRVRLPEGADAELLWTVALDGAYQVRHLVPHRESLEEAFVRVIAA